MNESNKLKKVDELLKNPVTILDKTFYLLEKEKDLQQFVIMTAMSLKPTKVLYNFSLCLQVAKIRKEHKENIKLSETEKKIDYKTTMEIVDLILGTDMTLN